MEDMGLNLLANNVQYVEILDTAGDVVEGKPFSVAFYEPLKALWNDPNVQKAYDRGNEAALPEKWVPHSEMLVGDADVPYDQSALLLRFAGSIVRSRL